MKITKKQRQKIRRQAIKDVLLFQAFVLFYAGIIVYGILF